jgi:nucleotide-binding universal stress UspA family protein
MDNVARGKIVVGVDGSEPSIEALEWAAHQAELTGATLDVVTAWAFGEEPTPFGIVPPVLPGGDPLTEARTKLNELVAAVCGRHKLVEVRADVVRGHAATVLLEAAQDADVLVVGSRGRGAFVEMLLGSVSEHCVRHAACPVVIVRPARQHTK